MRIRDEQLTALDEVRMPDFAFEMARHLADFTPLHAALLGEEGLREIAEAGVERARAYGFTRRGPVRFYIELLFMLGWGFDSDPQLPWARETLTEAEIPDQVARADRLHELAVHYRTTVGGKDGAIALRALRRAREEPYEVEPLPGESLERLAFRRMEAVHPEKCDYVGAEALRSLLQTAQAEAQRYSLSSAAAVGLVTGLMFALGSGVVGDPKYPWILGTLANRAISDPGRRAERLYSKAMTYLDQAIEHLEAG